MMFKNRKCLRLTEYDYSQAGYYFVTICVHDRKCLFGDIVNEEMLLNESGNMIYSSLQTMPEQYTNVLLDEFIVMPDHVHAIVGICENNSETNKSLFDIVGEMKSYTTSCYIQGVKDKNYVPFNKRLWQRGYYEHIIRDDDSLINIRQYIIDNPKNWKSPCDMHDL